MKFDDLDAKMRVFETAADATARLLGLSTADKHELLFAHGINFAALPAWQRRGTGFHWESYEKTGTNPKTGQPQAASRRRVHRDLDLPTGDAYAAFNDGRLGAKSDQ